ncbi:MAG: hypothetical protein ABEJ99_04575 [Candidatus Nanohaloarchaea archaeon]
MEEKFGIVLVAGLSFFGFLFIIGQGFNLTGPVNTNKMTYMDKSFGAVGKSNPDFRTVNFGDFTVGEARGDIRAFHRKNMEVSDGWMPFSSHPVWFQYNATEPKGGNVTFEVLGRRGTGKVYVKVNGDTVFNEALVATGTPEVTIPEDDLHPGMNDFEIGVSSGLFSSSSYALEDVDVNVNDRKFHDFKDSFNLYRYEVQDYIGSPLTFNIDSSVKTAPLNIKVNGKRVYSHPQVRVSGEKVNVTPTNSDLHPGSNSITFSTTRPSKYEISNAQLTVKYLGTVNREKVMQPFSLNETARRFADKDSTTEYVSFDYRSLLPSVRPLKFDINGFQKTMTPETGHNRFNLTEGNLKRDNQIEITSNGTYVLENLQVYSVDTGAK